jgi:hypothetical protein
VPRITEGFINEAVFSPVSKGWQRSAFFFIIIAVATAFSSGAFAQKTCEDLMSSPQTVQGVNRSLNRIYGLKTTISTDPKVRYWAGFLSNRGGSPYIDYSSDFKKLPATRQFAIALHETLHFSTYRLEDSHELTPVSVGRAIDAYGTKVAYHRTYYAFDEVEAKLREFAALVLNAKKNRLAKREAKILIVDLKYHLAQQKALVRNILRQLYEEKLSITTNDKNEVVLKNLNSQEERKFDTINIPLLEPLSNPKDLETYVQNILVIRLNSLETHRNAAARIALRIEKP